MQTRVQVRKSQLDYFRKLARESKTEIQAYLVGKVLSPELTLVKEFKYTKRYHTSTTEEVAWYRDDFERIKKQAEEQGYRIVGDIHSHPGWDAVLSATDYKTHIEDGHRISGICSVLGRRTRVRFWIAESSLPCVTEYV